MTALLRPAAATAVIGLFLVSIDLSHAAQRSRHADHARQDRVEQDRSAARPAYDSSRLPPHHPNGTSSHPWGPGYNLPYPDRPYGAPDRW